jgi:hypothetical protein
MLFFCANELSYNKSNSAGKNVMAGHLPKAQRLQKTHSAKNDGMNNQINLRRIKAKSEIFSR